MLSQNAEFLPNGREHIPVEVEESESGQSFEAFQADDLVEGDVDVFQGREMR